MRSKFQESLLVLGALIVLTALSYLYTRQSHRFPYYFLWDMDHTTTLDSMLVQDGKLPSNYAHPGFGMILMHKYTVKFARKYDLISTSTLEDLRKSLNPRACVAEHTDFLRRHSPFLCVGIVICLWISLQQLFRPNTLVSLLSLCVLGTMESLLYHSTMIRAELYSVFYWSVSILLLTCAFRTTCAERRLLWFFVAGVFLGLALLTKTQAIFYLASAGLFVLFLFHFLEKEDEGPPLYFSRKKRWVVVILGFMNLPIFYLLVKYSVSVHAPRGIGLFARTGFGITPILLLVGLSLIFLSMIQVLFLRKDTTQIIFVITASYVVISFGFLLSSALQFLIFEDPAKSLNYGGMIFKAVFLRKQLQNFPRMQNLLNGFLFFVKWRPLIVFTHFGLLISIVWVSLKSGLISQKVGLICVALSMLALANNVLAVRPILRDLLWAEVIYTFLIVLYLAILIDCCARRSRFVSPICTLLLSIILFSNIRHSQAMTRHINALYPIYGWNPGKHVGRVYGALQAYENFMLERTEGVISKRLLQKEGRIATHHERIRQIASFVLPNQAITLRQIGALEEGLPVWLHDLNYRIKSYPEHLEPSFVLDSSGASVNNDGLLYEDKARIPFGEGGAAVNKMMPPVSNPPVAVLPRSDIRVFLFLEESDDFEKVIFPDVHRMFEYSGIDVLPDARLNAGGPLKLVLSDGNEEIVLYGKRIHAYTTIPYKKLTGKYLLLIHAPFYL